jgi:hypothetical protein
MAHAERGNLQAAVRMARFCGRCEVHPVMYPVLVVLVSFKLRMLQIVTLLTI